MKMFPKANKGGNFDDRPPAPKGNHVARCYLIADLGKQNTVSALYGKKIKHKIVLNFELCHELMEDGRPFSVTAIYTYSFHENSNLGPILKSWTGSDLDDDFDILTLLGEACLLNVAHEPRDSGGVFVNVMAVTPCPKGMDAPKAVNPLVWYSPEDHSDKRWADLPKWIRTKIEGRVINENTQDKEKIEFDDKIPF